MVRKKKTSAKKKVTRKKATRRKAAKKKATKKKATKRKVTKKKATKKKATKKKRVTKKKATKRKVTKKKTTKRKATKKKATKKKATKKKATKKKTTRRKPTKKKATKRKAAKKRKAPVRKASASRKPLRAPKRKAAPVSDIPVRAAPRPGTTAPQFVLPSDTGAEVSLSSLRGKNVVLYFYPRDDTPGCTVEAKGFSDAYGKIKRKGAVVVGISRDSVKSHAKFKTKHQLPFTLLSDPDAEVISVYGSWGEKKFMGRTFMGIKRTTILIDKNGKIAKVYPKVSPKGHAAEILNDLSALE